MKYLFLLFSDGDMIPLSGKLKQVFFLFGLRTGPCLIGFLAFFLSEYVFNTEVRRGPLVLLSIREADWHDVYRRTPFPYLRRRFEQDSPDRYCCCVASYHPMRAIVFLSTSQQNLMMFPYCIIIPFIHWEKKSVKP